MLHDVTMKDMECKISPCCQIATHGFIFDMTSDLSAEVAVVVGEVKWHLGILPLETFSYIFFLS